jgi:regulatory protein
VTRKVRKLHGEELFNYGLRLLARRALSAGELRTRLQRRASEPAEVESVIGKMREYGYVDDERFAEHYAAARRDSGSVGRSRVLRDLRQRRVAPGVAQDAVQQAFEDVDEFASVMAWLDRKYRNVDLRTYLQEPKHLASAYRKLRYAGFGSAASVRALKRFADRADELEDEPIE